MQVAQLSPANSIRIASSTSHTAHKRSALLGVAQGGQPPATKTRTTDDLLALYQSQHQKDDMYKYGCTRIFSHMFNTDSRANKVQAALMAAHGQAVNQNLQALAFLSNLQESPFKTSAIASTQAAYLQIMAAPGLSQIHPIPAIPVVAASEIVHIIDDEDSNHPQPAVVEAIECVICSSSIIAGQPTMRTKCNHNFHFGCLRPWLLRNKDTCPTCRSDMQTGEPEQLSDQEELNDL